MTSERRSASARSGARSSARRASAEPRRPSGRTSPPQQLQDRFARALRLLRIPLQGPIVVATSGGADSATALLLLARAAPEVSLVACYVDHGIRPKASIARDLSAVRAQARLAKALVRVERVTLAAPSAGSPEERARVARYAALVSAARAAGSTFVVTGHQQDDLVETAVLALARGSGLDGVAAMRPMRRLGPDVTLARPLLWATKAQCEAFVRAARVPTSTDETNADASIPRNAVRAELARLERSLPGAARGIARSAALLADDKSLLDRVTAAAFARARGETPHQLVAAVLRRMPIALVRRVIRHAVALSGASLRDFSFEHCDAIALAVKQRRGGTFHAGKASVVLSAGKLLVQRAGEPTPADVAPLPIDLARMPLDVRFAGGHVRLRSVARRRDSIASRKSGDVMQLDLVAVRRSGGAEIRSPRPGDRCIPSGRSRPVSLARFLAKAGVPVPLRARAPLLCAGGRIAAVLGVRVMEPYKPKGEGPVLEVTWRGTDV